MRKTIAIIVAKTILFIGKKLHRGSTLPGHIALKIDKNILKKFKLPKISIVVTGSSGKTSTSYTIAHILRENGYSVAHNTSGANLSSGLASVLIDNCDLKGKIKKDAFVMEMDERYTKDLLPLVNPAYLVVCNITRDQPPRQGHFDYVYNIIKSGISDNIHLILNGDDPIVNQYSFDHKGEVSYFGVCKTAESFENLTSNSLDMVYCPKCNHKLNYSFVSFGNVGAFRCSNCDFIRPNIDYEISSVDDKYLIINNKYKYHPKHDQVYNFYNDIASFAVASLVGIEPLNIIKAMENVSYHEKRYSYFKLSERDGYVLSGKNENAPSYNQAMNYVGRKKEEKTIIFGFDYISLRYPYEDISWLYDIDFELLDNETIESFICVGPFAYDIAARVYLAGISRDKIKISEDTNDVCSQLINTKGNIYAILNLGTDKKFINNLEKNGIKVE